MPPETGRVVLPLKLTGAYSVGGSSAWSLYASICSIGTSARAAVGQRDATAAARRPLSRTDVRPARQNIMYTLRGNPVKPIAILKLYTMDVAAGCKISGGRLRYVQYSSKIIELERYAGRIGP